MLKMISKRKDQEKIEKNLLKKCKKKEKNLKKEDSKE